MKEPRSFSPLIGVFIFVFGILTSFILNHFGIVEDETSGLIVVGSIFGGMAAFWLGVASQPTNKYR